jgi:hypothetical protein
MNGGSDNAITHNAISNTAGTGILVVTWDPGAGDYNTSDTIAYNSIINANSATSGWSVEGSGPTQDAGAIDLGNTPGTNMNINIDNNYIDTLTDPSTGLDVGIYLDEWTSGVTATNNIVVGGNLGFEIHGGSNDVLTNNIFDIGPNTTGSADGLIQSNPGGAFAFMTGDVVSQNIFNSTATSTQTAYWVIDGSANVSNNLYYNTNGQPINTGGVDSNPISGNPQFANPSGGDFSLSSGSAASAIGFQSIDQSAIGLAAKTATWY